VHQPEEMRSAQVRVRHLHLDVRPLPQTRGEESTLAAIGVLKTNPVPSVFYANSNSTIASKFPQFFFVFFFTPLSPITALCVP